MAAVHPHFKITHSLLTEGYFTQQANQSQDQLKLVKHKDNDSHILQNLFQAIAQVEDFPDELLNQLQYAINNKISTSQLTQLYRKINQTLLAIAQKRIL